MDRRWWSAVVLAAAAASNGCANVIGLSDLEEVPCVGAMCSDASTGETLLVDTGSANETGDSATRDTAMADSTVDSELDSSTDATVDATDATVDATDATVDATDATVDAPLDTKLDVLVDTKVDTMSADTCTVSCDVTTSIGASCTGATCAYSGCKAGFANCDTTAPDTNGCETNATTTLNCGGCGNVCTLTNASTASCVAAACTYTCKSGFGDCDKSGANTNGCETPLNTLINCGACGSRCDTAKSTGAACTGTTCIYSGCVAGFANCDLSGTDANGCETAVDSDKLNCGGCARACSTINVAAAACAGSVCTSTCSPGFSNCNLPAAPTADDGCECATPTCCGTGCAVAHQNCVGAACGALGQNYFPVDACRAKGTPGVPTTYTAEMATAARDAWPAPGTVSAGTCGGGSAVCKTTATSGAVWIYDGTLAGYVKYNTIKCGGSFCCCPTASDSTWN